MVRPRFGAGASRFIGIAAACTLGALGSAAVSSACTMQLDISISCGDGFVDYEAGEECDPEDPLRSHESACADIGRPQGKAGCDETTCRIDKSFETCAVCGDGMIDALAGEECEGSDLGGMVCPGNVGMLQCVQCKRDYSNCRSCGNNTVEEGEECDPSAMPSLGIGPRPCAGDDMWKRIPSPWPSKPYTSGTYQICESTCTWNRSQCGYCGDDVLDDEPVPVDAVHPDRVSVPEKCDGDSISEQRLRDSNFWEECTTIVDPHDPDEVLDGVRPNVVCNASCQANGNPVTRCCVRAGYPCPDPGTSYADAGLKCCYEYAHQSEIAAGASACESPISGEGGVVIGLKVCRPFDLASD